MAQHLQLTNPPAAVHAFAAALGERIVLKGLAGQRTAADTLVIREDGGEAFVFRHGCVVCFDMNEATRTRILDSLRDAVRDPFPEAETDESEFTVSKETAQKQIEGEFILQDREPDTLHIVADVLAKSVVLSHYESKVADAFDKLQPLAERLQRTGRIAPRSKVLVQHIADGILTQHNLVGRIAVTDKPELLWEQPSLDRLHARLADEYELRERAAAVERKLELISDTAQILLDMLHTRRSLRVEWYIVLLILFEILLSLFRH